MVRQRSECLLYLQRRRQHRPRNRLHRPRLRVRRPSRHILHGRQRQAPRRRHDSRNEPNRLLRHQLHPRLHPARRLFLQRRLLRLLERPLRLRHSLPQPAGRRLLQPHRPRGIQRSGLIRQPWMVQRLFAPRPILRTVRRLRIYLPLRRRCDCGTGHRLHSVLCGHGLWYHGQRGEWAVGKQPAEPEPTLHHVRNEWQTQSSGAKVE